MGDFYKRNRMKQYMVYDVCYECVTCGEELEQWRGDDQLTLDYSCYCRDCFGMCAECGYYFDKKWMRSEGKRKVCEWCQKEEPPTVKEPGDEK